MLAKTQFREIAWEIGQYWSSEFAIEYLALAMVSPHLGLVHWRVRENSLKALRKDPRFARSPLVVRVYEVTDLLFDGTNAHGFFDLEVAGPVGNYYFSPPRLGRDYLAEIGLRAEEGSFAGLLRSNKVFFERDRAAGNYQTAGLFVGGGRKFPVENIFDAKVFEAMHHTLAEVEMPQLLRVALVFADFAPEDNPLKPYLLEFAAGIGKFGGQAQLFPLLLDESDRVAAKVLLAKRALLAERLALSLAAAHRQQPFSLIHCQDWYAAACALEAAEQLKLPVVLTLRSTEYERAQGYQTDHLSEAVCAWERKVIQAACLLITPHSSTRQQLINLYGAPPDKVVTVQGLSPVKPRASTPDPARIKADLGLNPEAPTGLFAGEVSHAAGADLLLEALVHVCHKQPSFQFLFAGDGQLKGELEARAWHSGIGQRVRFLGDVSSATFASILAACDFVVIPARTWQDEGLAQMAIEAGKPVLTTHQAGIGCIVHGQNGLVTYDNPGSLIWGIEELLHHPLQANVQHQAARKKAVRQISLDNLVAQHYLYYATALKNFHG